MSMRDIRRAASLLILGASCLTAYAATDVTASAEHRGQSLHADKCATCHAEKSGLGDGNLLYLRSDRKAKNTKQLEAMVARCNSELRLDLFPEDEADVTVYLSKNFYKFK